MKVERMKWITRDIVRANPDKAFLFGDNVKRIGMGGQARAMRGESNAFGIATKYSPDMRDDAFFSDDDFIYNKRVIDADIQRLLDDDMAYEIVVIPSDGLGTGLAELDKRAPETFAYLQERLAKLEISQPD